jgi:hypothetical protein
MLNVRVKALATLCFYLILAGCYPTMPRQLGPQSLELSAENAVPPSIAVTQAFEENDPQSRHIAVVSAIQRFLRDPAYIDQPDEITAAALTELAFSSNRLTLSDPALIQRDGSYTIVAIPDGIGLYFYDLTDPNAVPIELSQWTAGIQTLEATWQDDRVVIIYQTLDVQGDRHAHASLLTLNADSDWVQSWISDDIPDWWFNAANAAIEVAPDLSQIVVVGEATSTTQAFQEDANSPQRFFQLVWKLDETHYQLTTPSSSFRDRSEWAWATAIGSPYGTLVEFVERFQRNDQSGARMLAANDTVMAEARNFGLAFSGIPYKVETLDETHLLLTGYQGELIITFQPPQSSEDGWLLTNIAPQGAVAP